MAGTSPIINKNQYSICRVSQLPSPLVASLRLAPQGMGVRAYILIRTIAKQTQRHHTRPAVAGYLAVTSNGRTPVL